MSGDGEAEAPELERVLQAFQDYLPDAQVPGMRKIEVLDAWVEAPSAVFVVSRRASDGAPADVIGYRRDFPPHAEPDNPESSGIDLADDICEPLGAVVLRKDPVTGISWVGVVEPEPFPVRPGLIDRIADHGPGQPEPVDDLGR